MRLVAAREIGGRLHLRAAWRFGVVGVTGLFVNQLLLWGFVELARIDYLIGAVLATQGSTAWNFVLTDAWVFSDGRARPRVTRFLSFAAVNNAALLVRIPVLALITSGLGIHYMVSNFITLALLFVTRFAVSDRLIWKGPDTKADGGTTELSQSSNDHGTRPGVKEALRVVRPSSQHSAGFLTRGSGPKRANDLRTAASLRHTYDVGGFVSVGSEVQLKELEYFRSSNGKGDLDIEIRVGSVGRWRPQARIWVHQAPGRVAYEEHLGRLGANFQLDIGDRIRVIVGPLLARSPHVLYTNVIEALLRFVLVSRGRILLHSATVAHDGHGLMLSARTDTGKTGTILRLLQEQPGGFLADDMTIVDSTGTAFCYPKPLTISSHTLRAVNRDVLRPAERIALVFQSRLHSKGGRSLAQRLARLNVPIMAVNALTQVLVPPPKYMITRLVECEILTSTRLRDLFFIERGPSALETVDRDRAVEKLVENTDDAYGFPPFQYFAPVIAIGEDDNMALRGKERAVLVSALKNVVIRRIACEDFSWADTILRLVRTADLVIEQSPDSSPGPTIDLAYGASSAAAKRAAWSREARRPNGGGPQ